MTWKTEWTLRTITEALAQGRTVHILGLEKDPTHPIEWRQHSTLEEMEAYLARRGR